ncbi:uncharacterized protein LOC111371493 [Olea europaea var. sylvestris]|uniref:Uncharacterized protein n=1 Tax=Olea europaea subsp. europaea TaxID=158383 RepID=A0A8S0U0C0_OLEEU|nr:uncharacterized protein LOC111371493 [Olea europaea var. sylvestris]CAA3011361.1 Hypothetical predicted protein [Olea europaea subsp. europaea]
MSNLYSPIFPVQEPRHFTNYGFDPQIDYFQVLEEARKYNKRESSRSIDKLHFKLQKPISKDDSSKKIKKSKKRWWKNALLFFKRAAHGGGATKDLDLHGGVHRGRACIGSISGPVYITESRSRSSTPYRTCSRPSSSPLAGTLTPTRKDEMGIPYISLREINMDQQNRISSNATPIYLVT